MKILMISNMYPSTQKPYSGVFVKNQYEYLKSKLHKNIVIYTMKRTFTSTTGSFLKYLKFYFLLTPFLYKKYDILHIHFFGYHVFFAFIYKIIHPSIKLIVTFHGSDTKNIKKRIFKFMLSKFDVIISVGKEQSKYIYNHTQFNNIVVLPAGIDDNVFYKETHVKKIYDFIFIGSFYEIKGVDIFIDAIKKINNTDLAYCFVGSGKYLNEINSIRGRYNISIKENMPQREIRKLLNQSKWLVLPSRGDSFGLVVSEAMFCGTPVIVSNIGGMIDQVVDGKNGFVLKSNSSDDLKEIINKILLLPHYKYKTISQCADKSNKEYSMKNICEELITIYTNLVHET